MAEDSSSQHRYYHHSGQFSPGGALFALAAGLLAGAPLAFAYARFIHWDTYIYLNTLACAGFGALTGFLTQKFLFSAKSRSVTVSAVVAFLVALGSYYFCWDVWLSVTMQGGTIAEYFKPLNMFGAILAVNDQGTWSSSSDGAVTKGVELWVIWAGEALLIFGLALYCALHQMLEATFCEGCEVWTKEQTGACTVAAGAAPPLTDKPAFKSYLKGLKQHAAELKMHLENKDLAYLEQLGPVLPDALAWYRLDVLSCPQCSMTHTLRVTQVRKKVEGKKVRKQTESKEVLRQLILSRTEAEALRKLGTMQSSPAAEAAQK